MLSEAPKIIQILKEGGVVAMRTDTVYGLLARADNPQAIERIFAIKKRVADKGLPVLCADIHMAETMAHLDESQIRELSEIWPAAITAIVPAQAHVLAVVRGGSPNVALRVPADDDLRALIAAVEMPLVATSANISGQPEARSIDDIQNAGIDALVDLAIDGGVVPEDIKPSRIIDFTVTPHVVVR